MIFKFTESDIKSISVDINFTFQPGDIQIDYPKENEDGSEYDFTFQPGDIQIDLSILL